jgi:hypothetical protein
MPAMAAMAMTRDAGCCRSIHKPSASATTTKVKVRTPLPASAQLILMRGALVSKFAECVTCRVKFHAQPFGEGAERAGQNP